ncbi:hypothetical protein Baya_8824 [Bagarius yarrelli]|uniref:Uncharacterized protein n=1 Tax=Bagarius yarrelli TaxID=175774 RepID=A0A556U978_BAGYA|nr:hypothetical protein Baya_8824 [Bagarius yarrelli]
MHPIGCYDHPGKQIGRTKERLSDEKVTVVDASSRSCVPMEGLSVLMFCQYVIMSPVQSQRSGMLLESSAAHQIPLAVNKPIGGGTVSQGSSDIEPRAPSESTSSVRYAVQRECKGGQRKTRTGHAGEGQMERKVMLHHAASHRAQASTSQEDFTVSPSGSSVVRVLDGELNQSKATWTSSNWCKTSLTSINRHYLAAGLRTKHKICTNPSIKQYKPTLTCKNLHRVA